MCNRWIGMGMVMLTTLACGGSGRKPQTPTPDVADSSVADTVGDEEQAGEIDTAPDVPVTPADFAGLAEVVSVDPARSIARFALIRDTQDAVGLQDFLAHYNMPVCEGGKCLFVTVQAESAHVKLLSKYTGWTTGEPMCPLPFAPTVFYALINDPQAAVIEYKLKVDGHWVLDANNRHIHFGPYGTNSAVYATGLSRLELVSDVHSPQLDNSRSLYVYLPAAYFENSDARFPVLYMQDGFNVFQNPAAPFGSWDVEITADALSAAALAEPLIIVGIDTADRMNEYLYTDISIEGSGQIDPKLDAYGDFLVTVVKPLIDTTYRTRPEREATAIAGSSLGGISALYLAWMYSQTFGRVASFSGSFWVGDEGEDDAKPSMREIILANVEGVTPADLRIYLDSGDKGFDNVVSYAQDSWAYNDYTRNALINQGFDNRTEWDTDGDLATEPDDLPVDTELAAVPTLAWNDEPPAPYAGWADYLGLDHNLLALVGHGHQHNEAAWKQRFVAALIFLFPGPQAFQKDCRFNPVKAAPAAKPRKPRSGRKGVRRKTTRSAAGKRRR